MSMNCCMRDSLRYLSVNGTHKTSIKAPSKPVQYSLVGGGVLPIVDYTGRLHRKVFSMLKGRKIAP